MYEMFYCIFIITLFRSSVQRVGGRVIHCPNNVEKFSDFSVGIFFLCFFNSLHKHSRITSL